MWQLACIFSTIVLPILLVGAIEDCSGVGCTAKKPNIVFIFTDDQDRRMGSMDYQPILKRELLEKGTQFTNHYCTTAICCPSRASILKGQFAHNTNITHVLPPGGSYDKLVISGQDKDYLPHWLGKAGYRTEYIGKYLNGYSIRNYNHTPKGWDHIDAVIDPFTYWMNTPVFSTNGATPVLYTGYHQTDVIRAKALDRLDYLTKQEQPFYLTIAPVACHCDTTYKYAQPQARHWFMYPNITAPRTPNYNPPDEIQLQKSGWLKTSPVMTAENITWVDDLFGLRIRSLVGVDEIIEDVVALLERQGVLDNTYIVYTSDNGYHLGQWRLQAGKSLPYAEDTNLPFIVRGPGVPAGVTSKTPSTHIDLAATFLDIAQLDPEKYPSYLDGTSLLKQWRNPSEGFDDEGNGPGKEIINVEFWGTNTVEANCATPNQDNSSYKTLRIVGTKFSYLFVKWCTNEMELYDTLADPYELHNIANSTERETRRLIDRLNAVLMVTKSCAGDSCRNPWKELLPTNTSDKRQLSTLRGAMDPIYDDFFASIPKVRFASCMQYQWADNEAPYYPPRSSALGGNLRASTDFYGQKPIGGQRDIPSFEPDLNRYGDRSQRNTTVADLKQKGRNLTDIELGWAPAPKPAGESSSIIQGPLTLTQSPASTTKTSEPEKTGGQYARALAADAPSFWFFPNVKLGERTEIDGPMVRYDFG